MTQHFVKQSIEKGNGERSTPFRTFEEAVKIAMPGDTITLLGTYIGDTSINFKGDKDLRLTFTHEDGCIDGKGVFPKGPAKWVGLTGLEGVHTPLVMLKGLGIDWKIPVKNSRGRGFTIAAVGKTPSSYIRINKIPVTSCRTAGISMHDSEELDIEYVEMSDTSNYNTEKALSKGLNFSGSIKAQDCRNVRIRFNKVWNHYGNSITPGNGCENVTVEGNDCWDSLGTLIYANWSKGTKIIGNRLWFTEEWDNPVGAIAVNNEEETPEYGGTDGVEIADNIIYGARHAIGIWGNEGEEGVFTDDLNIHDNIAFNCAGSGLLVRQNANVRKSKVKKNYFHILKTGTPFNLLGPIDGIEFEENYSNVGGQYTEVDPRLKGFKSFEFKNGNGLFDLTQDLFNDEGPIDFEPEQMIEIPLSEYMIVKSIVERWGAKYES